MATAGLALLLCGLYMFGHALWRPTAGAATPPDTSGCGDAKLDALAARIHGAVGARRERRRILLMRLAWAGLLCGAFLLALAALQQMPADARSHVVPPGPSASAPVNPLDGERQAAARWLDGSQWIVGLLVLVGAALALFAGPNWAKASGVATIALSGALHGTTLMKVDKFFHLDTKVDVGGVQLDMEVRRQLEALSHFQPQYLGGVQGFALGKATLDAQGFGGDADGLAAAEQELRRICAAWTEQGERSDAMVLIVGGTDRLALAGSARSRYEANTGLAQARAASVKQDLERRCWSPLVSAPGRVLLLASGPSTTPDRATAEDKHRGYPQDRRADVWVLSAVVPRKH
jgi:hypothetical protein